MLFSAVAEQLMPRPDVLLSVPLSALVWAAGPGQFSALTAGTAEAPPIPESVLVPSQ